MLYVPNIRTFTLYARHASRVEGVGSFNAIVINIVLVFFFFFTEVSREPPAYFFLLKNQKFMYKELYLIVLVVFTRSVEFRGVDNFGSLLLF